MPIIDKPLPPPPRDSGLLSTSSRFVSASPEPISRSPSTASAAHYQRPRAPSPPSTRPPTEAQPPKAQPPKAQITVTYNQQFDAKALHPRNILPSPAAGPSTGPRMISVPFIPPEKPKDPRPTLWQSLKRTPQAGPSDGQWKSALPKYLMPPAFATPAPIPVVGPSRPRGGAKGKLLGGWKIPNLLPKWGHDHPDTRPPNPSGGRVITNLDDPEPEPEPKESRLLPPLLPSSPTVYTDDAYPAPRDTYGATSTAPSEADTSISRRPPRRSRPPPPPPGHRPPGRPTRALPPPASQASWITFGRFGQTPAPSTYHDGGESVVSGAGTEADRLTTAGDRSTYAANRETFTNHRTTFVSGRSVFTAGGVSNFGGIRSMDGMSDLASRPATPDGSPTKTRSDRLTRSDRFEPELESPIERPELPVGPSMMLSTVPSQYAPESPFVESPLAVSEPPIDSPSHPPLHSTYTENGTYQGEPYRGYGSSAPPSPEDERPRIIVTRADSDYPATAFTDGEDVEQSPIDQMPTRGTTYTAQTGMTDGMPRDTTYTSQTGMTDGMRAPRDTSYTAQTGMSNGMRAPRDTSYTVQTGMSDGMRAPRDTSYTVQTGMSDGMRAPRDTSYTVQTGMSDGMRAPSEIAATGNLTRNNTQVSRERGEVSRSNSEDSGTPEQSPTSDTKVSHHSDEKTSKRGSPTSAAQSRRRSRPVNHKRIADPYGRYSRKPFGYFHRYPRRSSALDPKNLTRASMRGARAAKGRSRASTSSSRTYIPSRIGRLRRLFKDLVNLPWRGDSDYYGGVRGITAAHHFRGGANRGGVSIRPRRDSNIPRAPWYRPKRSSMRMDMPRNPGQVQGWQGLRAGLNSPLTDGSDRGTLDRFGNLPASASPFVSPYQMRSPYDEVPPMPTIKKRTPSPLVPHQLTNGPIHASPSTMASNSPGSKSLKNQHALLDSYGTLSPPLRPVTAAPLTAIPAPDGYFFPIPPPGPPPPTSYRVPSAGVPSTAFPGVPSTAFPGVPSTAFQDYDEDEDEDVPRGITIHKPGEPSVWVPFKTPEPQHPPMPPPYGPPASPPKAYQRQAPMPRSRNKGRGLPVTLHATSTIAPSSPRTRAKQATQSTVTTEYAPSQIGAAV